MYFNKILIVIFCFLNVFYCTIIDNSLFIFNKKSFIIANYLVLFFLVVGEREKSSNTVNVRTRDNIVHGEFPISEVIEKFKILKQQRLPDSANVF